MATYTVKQGTVQSGGTTTGAGGSFTLPSGGTGGSTTGGTSTGWPQTSTTNANLNLRQSPSTASSVLTVMPNGSALQVTGPPQNGWYPVSYGGKTGWASAQFVNPPATPTPTPGTGTGGGTGGGTTPPATPAPAPVPHTPGGSNPFYSSGSTYGSHQNWYDTPLVKQAPNFDAEWEKLVTDSGFGGMGRTGNVARNLIDRAKSGFGAATMNNPGLDPRSYINNTLGPNFLRNSMNAMTPGQRGEMPGIAQPRSRWIDR